MPAFIGDFSCRRRLPATPPGGVEQWGVRQRDEGETPRQCARTRYACLARRRRPLDDAAGFSDVEAQVPPQEIRRRSRRPASSTTGGPMVRGIVRVLSGVLLA